MKRNLSKIMGVAITCLVFLTGAQLTHAADDSVSIHGFVSQGYLKSSDNNFLVESDEGSFQFNEMGLNFGYDTGSNVKIGAQLFARDLGDIGEDKVTVSWAFGDYKWRDWLGFRAGIMKMSLGLYNETRDVDSLRTCLILPQSVYNEGFRDVGQGTKGVALYGNVPLGAGGILKYDFKLVDVQVPIDSGTASFIKQRNPTFGEIYSLDFDSVYLGSVHWYTPLEGLLLGVSGYTTKSLYEVSKYHPGLGTYIDLDIDNKDQRAMTYSIEYTFQNLVLASEFQISDRKSSAYPKGSPTNIYGKTKTTSYYFSAAYRFTEWFEAGSYYSFGTADDDGSGDANELTDITLSTRFDITDNMVFKLEAHSMDGLFGAQPGDDGSTDDKWMLYAAKVSYTF